MKAVAALPLRVQGRVARGGSVAAGAGTTCSRGGPLVAATSARKASAAVLRQPIRFSSMDYADRARLLRESLLHRPKPREMMARPDMPRWICIDSLIIRQGQGGGCATIATIRKSDASTIIDESSPLNRGRRRRGAPGGASRPERSAT